MVRSILLYLSILSFLVSLIWLIYNKGAQLPIKSGASIEHNEAITKKVKPLIVNSEETISEQFLNNMKHPASLLFLQIVVILVISRLFSSLAAKLGQQSVIGEIIAGIFLGPSVMGWLFPGYTLFVFPVDSLRNLQFLSQIGLVFFMFIVGMELDLAKLTKKRNAIIISHTAIAFSFLLGVLLAYFIYMRYAPDNTRFLPFALFLGISLSITAFPVLARILQERGLTKTPLGILAITCAAADDITAWCLLAAIITVVKAGSIVSAMFTIGLALIFVLLMVGVLKPWIARISNRLPEGGFLNKSRLSVVFLVILFSAFIAELIGIHAILGAFLAGILMPDKERLKREISDKIQDISTLVLLPIFFAFTGLRTQIGLLNEGHLWGLCMFVILLAVVGKVGGATLATRIVGHSWRQALSIGVLMNTRGLMELIILNIGYDLGILTPQLFTIMVIMALVTTFMTGPLLTFIEKH